MYKALNEMMNEYFLQQIVHSPTHKDGNTLDILLTNNRDLVHSYNCIPTLTEISHHYMVEVRTTYNSAFTLEAETKEPDRSLNQYNYFDENIKWGEIVDSLKKHDWILEFKDLHPLKKFERFIEICIELSDRYVPKRKPVQKQCLPPRERRILMRKRGKLMKRWKSTSNKVKATKLKDRLVQIEKELQESYRKKALHDEKKALKAIKKNSKYFFMLESLIR